MISLPKRPAPRSRFLLVFCIMVLMGLIGAQMFLNRAGAQKQEEKKLQTTTDPSSSVSPAATTKPTDKELKQKLTPEQYYVTQKCGTEPPFNNAYWNNHTPGSTLMSSPVKRSSLHSINSTAVAAGPVSPNRSRKKKSPRNRIAPWEWNGPKSAARKAMLISVMSLTMGRSKWTALLRQFRRAPFHPSRETKGRRLQPVSSTVRAEEVGDVFRLARFTRLGVIKHSPQAIALSALN